MQKQLNVINKTKCFDAIETFSVVCERRTCKHWIADNDCRNCVMVATKNGPQTLQKINNLFDLTRVKTTNLVETVFTKIKEIC